MPIFCHKKLPKLGHSRGMSLKFICLFVQIPDYFSSFCFIFCTYIMFIYCHTVNKNRKIRKEINKKIENHFMTFHFISLHVIHISCCMVKYSFPYSILELKMGDSLETRINTIKHIQKEFGHDIQEMEVLGLLE